jgi:hypothetical protein
LASDRAGLESNGGTYPGSTKVSGRRDTKPNTNACRDPECDPSSAPGTFTDAHVDSGSHTYCDANANSHGSGDTDTRAVFNADGYCDADCDCHAKAYA